MDTAWIQVFVLSLSECVAPAGKTVCQEQEVQYQFFSQDDCQAVLRQFVRSAADNVIIDERKSRCVPTVRQADTYSSLQEANEQLGDAENWGGVPTETDSPPVSAEAHDARLDKLPDCDSARSVTPCKIGQIIVESDATREVPVWRRDAND